VGAALASPRGRPPPPTRLLGRRQRAAGRGRGVSSPALLVAQERGASWPPPLEGKEERERERESFERAEGARATGESPGRSGERDRERAAAAGPAPSRARQFSFSTPRPSEGAAWGALAPPAFSPDPCRLSCARAPLTLGCHSPSPSLSSFFPRRTPSRPRSTRSTGTPRLPGRGRAFAADRATATGGERQRKRGRRAARCSPAMQQRARGSSARAP
jgi:hypothetical protein